MKLRDKMHRAAAHRYAKDAMARRNDELWKNTSFFKLKKDVKKAIIEGVVTMTSPKSGG